MSKRKPAKQPQPPQSPGIHSLGTGQLLRARVNRLPGGDIAVDQDLANLPRPARTMPVDCGRVATRFGAPEIYLGQLDPFNEKRLVRVLVARYTRPMFIRHVAVNEVFRASLLTLAKAGKITWEDGDYSRLFEEAKVDGPVVTMDVDNQIAAAASERGSIVFVSSMPYELHLAAAGKRTEVHFSSEIEVTMPMQVLADVLLSWKNTAGAL